MKKTRYFLINPGANRAYRARWAEAWAKMLQTGAASPEEEEEIRKEILLKEGGVHSSRDLDEAGYDRVMMHLGMILGESEKGLKNPWRAKRIRKIELIAQDLRPEDPESYILGVLDDMGIVRDATKWRTALIDDYLHNTMLTMISQQRREEEKRRLPEAKESVEAEAPAGARGMRPVPAETTRGFSRFDWIAWAAGLLCCVAIVCVMLAAGIGMLPRGTKPSPRPSLQERVTMLEELVAQREEELEAMADELNGAIADRNEAIAILREKGWVPEEGRVR